MDSSENKLQLVSNVGSLRMCKNVINIRHNALQSFTVPFHLILLKFEFLK